MTTTTTTATVSVDFEDDTTYVFLGADLAGSVSPEWAPNGAGRIVVTGWIVRDERGAGAYCATRPSRAAAEASLAHLLGIPVRDCAHYVGR